MGEFAIKDCNGYILQFGQDLMHEENNLLLKGLFCYA